MLFQTLTEMLVGFGAFTCTCAVMFFVIADAPGPVGVGTVDWAWSVQISWLWSSVPHHVTHGVVETHPPLVNVPPEYVMEYAGCEPELSGSTAFVPAPQGISRQQPFAGFARTETPSL